jgi:hypothetical protein
MGELRQRTNVRRVRNKQIWNLSGDAMSDSSEIAYKVVV